MSMSHYIYAVYTTKQVCYIHTYIYIYIYIYTSMYICTKVCLYASKYVLYVHISVCLQCIMHQYVSTIAVRSRSMSMSHYICIYMPCIQPNMSATYIHIYIYIYMYKYISVCMYAPKYVFMHHSMSFTYMS